MTVAADSTITMSPSLKRKRGSLVESGTVPAVIAADPSIKKANKLPDGSSEKRSRRDKVKTKTLRQEDDQLCGNEIEEKDDSKTMVMVNGSATKNNHRLELPLGASNDDDEHKREATQEDRSIAKIKAKREGRRSKNNGESWKVSEPTGGRLLDIDPVFSANDT